MRLADSPFLSIWVPNLPSGRAIRIRKACLNPLSGCINCLSSGRTELAVGAWECVICGLCWFWHELSRKSNLCSTPCLGIRLCECQSAAWQRANLLMDCYHCLLCMKVHYESLWRVWESDSFKGIKGWPLACGSNLVDVTHGKVIHLPGGGLLRLLGKGLRGSVGILSF